MYIHQHDLETFPTSKYNLGITLAFLYQEFLFLLWVQLSFINICGTYINLWFCGAYTNIFLCMILIFYYIKCQNINKIFECLLFLFNLIWAGAGLYFQQSSEWNDSIECRNSSILKPTIIFYIMNNVIFTWFITQNKK
jgi:hypothetical protein